LPNLPGRYAGRLDSFHTIQVPQDANALADFVRRCRIGRLHEDFIRDLHSRIFGAFASQGFEKCGWYSDADVEFVVSLIKADLAAARFRVENFEVVKAQWAAAGDSSKMQPELDLAKDALRELEAQAAPFRAESERRALSKSTTGAFPSGCASAQVQRAPRDHLTPADTRSGLAGTRRDYP
jgi:hypothetical protein